MTKDSKHIKMKSKQTHEQTLTLLSDFGEIPRHQVKFIYDMAYDAGWNDCKEEQPQIEISSKRPPHMGPAGEACFCDGSCSIF